MKYNPETRARAKGYVRRPPGYQGINDAWLCGECGRVAKKSDTLMKPHQACKGGFALALIKESEK